MGERRLNILYLSPNMAHYGGANYQHDVMQELSRQATVFPYGPGFRSYRDTDSLGEALVKAGFAGGVDWIVCGHAWLEDRPGAPVEKFAHLDLTRTNVPKAAILNKEYTNLEAKLRWMGRAGIDQVFTHHHDASGYAERTRIPFTLWPFAADHRLFCPPDEKSLDLGFSGILQNPTPGMQSDLRVRVMNRLYECAGDLQARPRDWARGLRVRFNALPRSEADRKAAAERGLYRHMDAAEYAAMVRSARAFLCTRSPADLVSPRYFECMLSRTLVIAERSPAHRAIFPEGVLLEFGDEAEFEAVVKRALAGDGVVGAEAIVERAYRLAMAEHTWERRVRALVERLSGVGASV